jgi:hypothetical protein
MTAAIYLAEGRAAPEDAELLSAWAHEMARQAE